MSTLFAFQLRRVGRNRQFLFFTVLLPALFTVFSTKVFGAQAGTSGRTVTFTAAEGGFDGLPGVTATERLGDRVVLTTDDVEATLLALLAGGRRLPDLDVRGASLEEAVLSLTSRSRAPIGAGR